MQKAVDLSEEQISMAGEGFEDYFSLPVDRYCHAKRLRIQLLDASSIDQA